MLPWRMRMINCLMLCVLGCGKASDLSLGVDAPPASEFASAAYRAETADSSEAGESSAAVDVAAAIDRKIIYQATLALVVEDFDRVEDDVRALVKAHHGYIADASVDRTQGMRRFGRWVIRVPADEFEALLTAAMNLGVPETQSQTAQDVTDQFVDLEARIATKKQLEERILALLDETRGKITDLIEVERELARVRSEIEQMEGSLRYLANRVAMTTITVTIREERDYVPPQAPTLTTRIVRAWTGSLAALRRFGEGLTIVAVAAAPWLIALIIVFTPLVWLLRRRRRRGGDGERGR